MATIQRITRVLRKIEIVQFVQIDCALNHHKRILAAPRQKSHCACSAVQKRSLWVPKIQIDFATILVGEKSITLGVCIKGKNLCVGALQMEVSRLTFEYCCARITYIEIKKLKKIIIWTRIEPR